MSKELRKTLFQMSVGILLYEVIIAVLSIFVYKTLGYTLISIELGILVGTILTILLLFDMAYATEEAVTSKDRKYAQKITIIHSVGRKIAVIICIAIFWNSEYVNVVALIIATLGLKPGAYLQPIVNKIFLK